MNEEFTHTVHDYTDKTKRKHFKGIEQATVYANELLRAGHKVKIFSYSLPKRYVDIVVARGRDY